MKTIGVLLTMLGSTWGLGVKAAGFHWNVVGPSFGPLHSLFGSQYDDLVSATDEVAERLRALRVPALGSPSRLASLSSIGEASGDDLPASEMIRELVAGHEVLAEQARTLFEVAESEGDVGTCDLASRRVLAHEKAAWMLRSHLEIRT